MKRTLRIGTRESRLAMVQTGWVVRQLECAYPEIQIEQVGMTTQGDQLLTERLDKIGGKGLFVRELELALLEGRIDLAVHSMKDLPSQLHPGLCLAAVSVREDPRDALVSRDGRNLHELPQGAVIGTSSLRREYQLAAIRPDLQFKMLRGNVPTRIAKLDAGEYDAIVLACAGLNRLGLQDRITEAFSPECMVPAAGQGVLAIEVRCDDDVAYLRKALHCPEVECAVTAERAFMAALGGSCTTPLGAYAHVEGGTLRLLGWWVDEISGRHFTGEQKDLAEKAGAIGKLLAERFLRERDAT